MTTPPTAGGGPHQRASRDETNNAASTQPENKVVIDIGIAAVRPAEFTQFRSVTAAASPA